MRLRTLGASLTRCARETASRSEDRTSLLFVMFRNFMISDHQSLRVFSLPVAFLDSFVGAGERNRGCLLSLPLFVLVQRAHTHTHTKMAVRGDVPTLCALPSLSPRSTAIFSLPTRCTSLFRHLLRVDVLRKCKRLSNDISVAYRVHACAPLCVKMVLANRRCRMPVWMGGGGCVGATAYLHPIGCVCCASQLVHGLAWPVWEVGACLLSVCRCVCVCLLLLSFF